MLLTQRGQSIVPSRQLPEKHVPGFMSHCGSYCGEGQKVSREIYGCSVLGGMCGSVPGVRVRGVRVVCVCVVCECAWGV